MAESVGPCRRRRERPDEAGMKEGEPKPWNPECPKCRLEFERMMELSRSVYEDLDHGAALYRLPLPPCTHPEAPAGQRGPECAD